MEVFSIKLGEEYNLGTNATLTAYLPQNLKEMGWENDLRPAVVLCPGGGYRMVSEREAEPVALKLLTLKLNVFILNYSVAPARYPTQLLEVAAAFDIITKNAKNWHTDKNNIGVMGFSAGGHLAAHYSNRFDIEEIKKVVKNPKQPDFCVLGYPVISADPAVCHLGSFKNLLGIEDVNKEIVENYSCDRMVNENTPKTFIFTTCTDATVPAVNSMLYSTALAKNNIPYCLHIYPYGRHGLATADEISCGEKHLTSPAVYRVADWIEEFKHWVRYSVYKNEE